MGRWPRASQGSASNKGNEAIVKAEGMSVQALSTKREQETEARLSIMSKEGVKEKEHMVSQRGTA